MDKYESYIDSGIDWLGKIPEHWEVKRLGNWFEERREKVSDKDFEPLSVTKNGILPQLENAAKSNDGDNRKLVKKGDFVINSRSDRKGSSGLSNLDGSVSLINIVMKPRNIKGKFTNYLLKSNGFIEEFYRNGHGIVADLWTTRYDEMKFINLAVPPIHEQEAIASFLDDKCTKIDDLLGIKTQQIEKLKELRQVKIHQSVTKGLDASIELNDSGIDWIGEIPKHWEVKRLKNFICDLEGGVSVNASESESANSNEIGVLKTSAVYTYSFDPLQNKKVFENELNRVSCRVRKGAIIISRMNAPELVGASGLVLEEYPNLYLPDRLWQTKYHKIEFNKKWLSQLLVSNGFRSYMTTFANGSSPSMKNISKGDFLNISIPVPPLSEQEAIVANLEQETSKIDQAIAQRKKQIEKLKEYKQSLINEVVTGKVKVA